MFSDPDSGGEGLFMAGNIKEQLVHVTGHV